MEFRPCIDIHNGKVKQIVGSSLADEGDKATENFTSEKGAAYYAEMYHSLGIKGGHVILLNGTSSEYYNATKEQALSALSTYPGSLQIGGGITDANAPFFIKAGASHVIVTSFVFKNGAILYDNLAKLVDAVGPGHIVLDLSCRKTASGYKIVTDRWQTITDITLDNDLLDHLASYCDEYLIHAVDVEGKKGGIDDELVFMLGNHAQRTITYAGGVGSLEDIKKIKALGQSRVNVTIGSALDIFGGTLNLSQILALMDH